MNSHLKAGKLQMDNLLRFNFNQKYLIFDTETEGLNLISSKPWQIAWIDATGKKINKKQDRLLFWDDLNVSKDAARITGFNETSYRNKAEDPKKVWREFSEKLYDEDYMIVGQNILGYDVYILKVWAELIGEKIDFSFIKRCIDTKSLETAIAKGCTFVPTEDRTSFLYKYLNYRERGLKTNQKFLLEKYEIPFDESKLHDALYDIEKNYEIFLKQINNIEI